MPTRTVTAANQRSSVRHPVDHPVIAEHAKLGDLKLRIVNVSPEGLMAIGAGEVGRGERLLMRLPVVGRIEAVLMWQARLRAGFRFERLIRLNDFTRMLIEVGPGRHPLSGD